MVVVALCLMSCDGGPEVPTAVESNEAAPISLLIDAGGADSVHLTLVARDGIVALQGDLVIPGGAAVRSHGVSTDEAIAVLNTEYSRVGRTRVLALTTESPDSAFAVSVVAQVGTDFSAESVHFIPSAVSGTDQTPRRLDTVWTSGAGATPWVSVMEAPIQPHSAPVPTRSPYRAPGASEVYGDGTLDGAVDVLDVLYAANLSVGNPDADPCIVGTYEARLDCIAVNVRPINAPGLGESGDRCGPGVDLCGSSSRTVDVLDVLAIALESVGTEQEVVGEPVPRGVLPTGVVDIAAGVITGTRTLTADTTYRITVDDLQVGDPDQGVTGTLVVEPGTVVLSTDHAIVVHRGSRIEAVGTPTDPVVFTCEEGPAEACWEGVRINGLGDETDSGVLRHVLVLGAERGIVLTEVGSGTGVRGVQVDVSSHTALGLFGGDVDISEVLISRALSGDGFVAGPGWTGRAQDVAIVWPEASSGPAVWVDAGEDAPGEARLYNFTLVTPNSLAVRLDNGAVGELRNFLLIQPGTALDVNHSATCQSLVAGTLVAGPWLVAGADLLGDRDDDPAECGAFGASPNAERDYLLAPETGTRLVGAVDEVMELAPSPGIPLDLRPVAGSEADTPADVALPPDDGFFEPHGFFGAFEPAPAGIPWYLGWSVQEWVMDLIPGVWSSRPSLPIPVRNASAASDGTLVHTFGGYRSGVTDRHQVYDTRIDRWLTGTAVPVGLDYAMAAYLSDGLYHLVGGNQGTVGGSTEKSAVHWIYDPQTDEWSEGVPAPIAVGGAAYAVYEGEFWLVAGARQGGRTDEVSIYDPTTDEWRVGPQFPVAEVGMSAAVRDGVLHVLGSLQGVHYVYDPTTESWEPRADVPGGAVEPGVGVFEGQVCVFAGGGRGPSEWCYDHEQDLWEVAPPLPSSRQGVAYVTVDGALYAIGGRSEGSAIVHALAPN